jgi:hypothetical protein
MSTIQFSTINNLSFSFLENNTLSIQNISPALQEIDELLNQLEKTVTRASLQAGEHDKEINACLALCKEKNDMEGVKRLAYIAFAGLNDTTFGEMTILYTMIHCKNVKIEDIISLFEAALLGFKSNWKPQSITQTAVQVNQAVQNKFWGQEVYQPTDKVVISHGGGLRYLKSIFNGEKEGYQGGCIWVSPGGSPRDNSYATRTPPRHFDIPFIFQGVIEIQYLKSVPNYYEALLPVKWLSKIENIEGCFGDFKDCRVSEMPMISRSKINTLFETYSFLNNKCSGLKERMIKIIEEKISQELNMKYKMP